MTVESHGIGILGHVFTRPERRRQGIISHVMERQMDHFRARGGQALTLGTGFERPPYWIYRGFGFRNLVGGFMRYETDRESGLEQRWFRPASASVVPAAWRHWPQVAFLASYPATDTVRSVAWGVFGISNLEHPYVEFMAARRVDPKPQCVVLETEHGGVGACATLTRMPLWPGVWLLDVFAHPNFEDRMVELIGALDLPHGIIAAYTDDANTPRTRALETSGFTLSGTLRNWLPPWVPALPSDPSETPESPARPLARSSARSSAVRVYMKD